MQCSCHVRASMGPAVQALHLNTRIFHFCHLGKTLREQPSPILKQFILEYSWLIYFCSTERIFSFFLKFFFLQGETSWEQPLPGTELPRARRPRGDRRRCRSDRCKQDSEKFVIF